jgi:hypothetical protein
VCARGAPYIKGGQILGDLVKRKLKIKEKETPSYFRDDLFKIGTPVNIYTNDKIKVDFLLKKYRMSVKQMAAPNLFK